MDDADDMPSNNTHPEIPVFEKHLRYTLRLEEQQARRLSLMGRVEKRRFAAFFRTVLTRALDSWERKYNDH